MSLLSYALTTVARQKQFLGITETTYDAVLEATINATTDWIEHYCKRRFKKTAYAGEKYTGKGSKTLQLRNFPVDSTATFHLERRDSQLNEGGYSAIETNVYVVDYSAGLVNIIASTDNFFTTTDSFARIPDYYSVTYTAGYDYNNSTTFLADVGAADLEHACWKLVAAAFNQRKQSGNIESEKIGDYSVTYTKEIMLDSDLKAILGAYRSFSM